LNLCVSRVMDQEGDEASSFGSLFKSFQMSRICAPQHDLGLTMALPGIKLPLLGSLVPPKETQGRVANLRVLG